MSCKVFWQKRTSNFPPTTKLYYEFVSNETKKTTNQPGEEYSCPGVFVVFPVKSIRKKRTFFQRIIKYWTTLYSSSKTDSTVTKIVKDPQLNPHSPFYYLPRQTPGYKIETRYWSSLHKPKSTGQSKPLATQLHTLEIKWYACFT